MYLGSYILISLSSKLALHVRRPSYSSFCVSSNVTTHPSILPLTTSTHLATAEASLPTTETTTLIFQAARFRWPSALTGGLLG